MENHKLVMPEHLNHFGYLFGGNLLKWVDEQAWIAASLEYPCNYFVTIAMDKVEFRQSIREGTILRFVVEKTREGTTSVQYEVTVFRGGETGGTAVFSTHVTLVRIDEKGSKIPLSSEST
jgi:acyl-CoA hydrolase